MKYTPVEHPDYRGVQMCLQKMKGICNATNEAKRRWEKLEEIAEWQNTIEGWEVWKINFIDLNVYMYSMCVNGILYVDQFLYYLTHTNAEETVHVGMCFVSK